MIPHALFARRTGVRRLVSILSAVLIITAYLFSGVPVEAENSDLDPSFNFHGVVITDQAQFDEIKDIVIQPDGKIVAVGHSGFLNTPDGDRLDVMVARYNIDGSLDAVFGNGGIVTTSVVFDARAMGVALQEDGKIVVAGSGAASLASRFAVVRYNTDGSLDPGFGIEGIVTERIGRGRFSRINDVAIQSDGKIVVAGEADDAKTREDDIVATLARFDSHGFLDFDFGSGGVSQPVPAGFVGSPMVTFNGIALQEDQKIVAAGVCGNTFPRFCVSRYNSDGSFDNTFNGEGLVVPHLDASSGAAKAVRIQPDGKILAAGQVETNFCCPVSALARFNTDGSLDTSFGQNGNGEVMVFEFPQLRVESLAVKPNGKIVIVGEAVFHQFHSAMTMARYTSDGFIEDLVTASIGERSGATAVAVQPDGRVVVGGFGNFSNEFGTFSDFALARYGANNAPIVSINGPPSGSIFAVNTPVDFSGTFIDDPFDTHTAEWIFDSEHGTLVVPASASFGVVSTSHTFTEPGVYKVSLKVTDDNLLSSTATTVDGLDALVVIYDPNGGWVAGGGWIESPEGAFASMPELTGKANFGFVSKYQNGASVPTGNAQFSFSVAGLKFQSTSYEWLVISGGRKAQYKGTGTINGSGSFNFMLTAIDGDQPGGGGPDKFRIRIWSDSDGLIYDNQLNAPDSDDPTTALSGGSIVIHH
jgi:uncharacterized delta-60 repeat protein